MALDHELMRDLLRTQCRWPQKDVARSCMVDNALPQSNMHVKSMGGIPL